MALWELETMGIWTTKEVGNLPNEHKPGPHGALPLPHAKQEEMLSLSMETSSPIHTH